MEVISRKEAPFPEDLEGRLNAVLNVVNTELKSVTLLHLDDVPREATEIKARIRETVGEDCYLPQRHVFGDYCHQTLFPIGTVAEETITREGVETFSVGYSLTEAGKRFGRPVAALALQFVTENGMSLYEVSGSTQSNGKTRSPLNRVKILKLLNEGNLNITNLANKISLGLVGISEHLKSLAEIGFIEYNSVGEMQKGKGAIKYQYVENTENKNRVVQPTAGYSILTVRAFNLLKERKRITLPKAGKFLNYPHMSTISKIYSDLVRQGFAVREEDFVGGEKLSEVKLLDKTEQFLLLEQKIEEILSEKISEQEAEQIYLDILNRADFGGMCQIAIEAYKKVSPGINRKSAEERTDEIMTLLRGHPGMRASEILKEFGTREISAYLTPLVKSGLLRKEKKGRETRYYLNQ